MNSIDNAKFITIEGVEGVGKSTNIEFMASYLRARGVSVCVTREPGGTPLAEEIRALLLSDRAEQVNPVTELLLVFASRSQHLSEKIEKQLQKGVWVLCDRFTDATFAYQGCGRGLPVELIAQLETMVQKDRQPDRTIYLDLPVASGLKRARQRGAVDRFERESVEFFERVRQGYLQRIAANPKQYTVIDASPTLAQVQAEIARALEQLLEESTTEAP